jgi:hypothetical protein
LQQAAEAAKWASGEEAKVGRSEAISMAREGMFIRFSLWVIESLIVELESLATCSLGHKHHHLAHHLSNSDVRTTYTSMADAFFKLAGDNNPFASIGNFFPPQLDPRYFNFGEDDNDEKEEEEDKEYGDDGIYEDESD